MNMDTYSGIYSFKDSSFNNFQFSAVGNAVLSQYNKKNGNSSLYLNGATDCLLADSAKSAFNFSTGDFTIEGWFYTDSPTTYMYLIGPLTGNGLMQIGINIPTSGTQTVGVATTYVAWPLLFTGGASIVKSRWMHFAVCRSGTLNHCFLNGARCGNIISDSTPWNLDRVTIGKSYNGASWAGYLDDFRITKGIARYTSPFQPPTTAFPNS